jgi:hypothetical protein
LLCIFFPVLVPFAINFSSKSLDEEDEYNIFHNQQQVSDKEIPAPPWYKKIYVSAMPAASRFNTRQAFYHAPISR